MRHSLNSSCMFCRSDFKDLPFQAVECCLADVKPPSGKYYLLTSSFTAFGLVGRINTRVTVTDICTNL